MPIEPVELPYEWLIELGRLSAEWAAFEQWLNLMIQKVAGFNDPFDGTFSILVIHSSFPQRLDMLASLCERNLAEFPNLNGYKDVIALFREAQKLRNRYTHNVIGMNKTANGLVANIATISARGKLKSELQQIKLEDVTEARNKMKSAVNASYRLILNANPQSGEKLT